MAEKTSTDAEVVELVSSLPIEECRLLLQAAMDAPWEVIGSGLVAGRISESKLYARKQIWYVNSFQPRLVADMHEQVGRTLIQCRFSLRPIDRALGVLWFVCVFLIGGPIFIMSLLALTAAPSRAPASAWEGILVPIGMLVFGIGNNWLGRYLARDERQFLIAFVRDTVAAIPL